MKSPQLLKLGILVGTCTFAVAQDEPKRPERPERPAREIPAEVLEKFDKDGDGKISREEHKAMGEERQKEMLSKFDKDGDGKLSDEERTAMREEMQARHKQLLEKYDADKNGKLSPEEIKTARDAGEKMPPRGGPGGKEGREGKPRGGKKDIKPAPAGE